MQAEKQDPFRIVIVGGGFAGVFAARRLQRLHRLQTFRDQFQRVHGHLGIPGQFR